MADQHGIGLVGIEPPIGFIDEIVAVQHRAASECQRLVKVQRLRLHGSHRIVLLRFDHANAKTRLTLACG